MTDIVRHRGARAGYHPCRIGLHVCGADHEAGEFFTQVNMPTPKAETARILFATARAELSCAQGEIRDFVVDLMINGAASEDFDITRQMLPRLERLYRTAIS